MNRENTALKSELEVTSFHRMNFLSTEAKIEKIQFHFSKIMETLGLDLSEDGIKETPARVARMFVKEIFSGLDHKNYPEIALFENKHKFNGMLIEKNITLHSFCEHHFIPFFGKAHVAYFPKDKVIGLSKINRLVQYFSSKPQVQENLTIEVSNELKRILETEDVAVCIEANHLCVAARGIRDTNSVMKTSSFSGKFADEKTKLEFFNSLNSTT